jgi:zinc transporter ZupT
LGDDKILPHLHPNFPESVAVSLPLRGEGMSRRKSFFYGQFSGMVEPIAAVIGAFAVAFIEPLLPYALSFAAGAMIFVVTKEVIPGSQDKGNKDLVLTMSFYAGRPFESTGLFESSIASFLKEKRLSLSNCSFE